MNAFVSYSHEDSDLLKKLITHLSALRREGLLDAWTDRDIHAGDVIDDHINTAMEEANLFLLLVSASFIHSEYCFAKEFKRACERQAKGEAIVVPLIVRECDWKIEALRRYKALPDDGKPVVSRHWHNEDEAFANITAGLRKVLQTHKLGIRETQASQSTHVRQDLQRSENPNAKSSDANPSTLFGTLLDMVDSLSPNDSQIVLKYLELHRAGTLCLSDQEPLVLNPSLWNTIKSLEALSEEERKKIASGAKHGLATNSKKAKRTKKIGTDARSNFNRKGP